ncbi:uncharacterized protein BX664DRAFT_325454 [Halteromyces radiatus]|uniref:uncharacterized protein n=1 Tax=Halteromyces radiatus TaxID=101107 RepID=UPI00221EEA85|nr:uncharacterized protein BX664DRAFT_325454 [Halteromyces radiatus]KAI8097039.1 hypothetical protein BX664DRAFT_325454 [Halteromyces radiatus]
MVFAIELLFFCFQYLVSAPSFSSLFSYSSSHFLYSYLFSKLIYNIIIMNISLSKLC